MRPSTGWKAAWGGVSIGVLGLSAGGAAAIHAAATDARFGAVVTVGAFAHPVDAMEAELSKGHIPSFPLVWLLTAYLQVRMNLRFSRIAPEHVIAQARGRFLLVHGEEDRVVPFEHARRLKAAARIRAASLWPLPGPGAQ